MRIIRVPECCKCPEVYEAELPEGEPYFVCGIKEKDCPPTGTPDWCPLEVLEEKGGGE